MQNVTSTPHIKTGNNTFFQISDIFNVNLPKSACPQIKTYFNSFLHITNFATNALLALARRNQNKTCGLLQTIRSGKASREEALI